MSDDDTTSADGNFQVGVRFRHNPKIYSFAAEGMTLSVGDQVLVRSEKGVDIGEVMVIEGRISGDRAEDLMPVVRKATEDDLEHLETQKQREERALEICAEKIEEHGLPMKLIDASLSFDHTRLVFFFSADGRVDFRELVRDLASTFRLRIELRQIGVRDEAKLIGGLGPCGRPLCCNTFMRDFAPVGIRVAKDQDLALNPNKISGLCDRLMCCLLFEHEGYLEAREKLPERGEHIQTPHGPARVTDIDLLREQITVELEEGNELTLDVEVLESAEQERRPSETSGGEGEGDGPEPDQDGGQSG